MSTNGSVLVSVLFQCFSSSDLEEKMNASSSGLWMTPNWGGASDTRRFGC